MTQKYISAFDIESFKLADSLSDSIWNVVSSWTIFEQKTIGEQLVRSVDSISANIVEGYGRFYLKDKIRFFYYARGSINETICWINKAYRRRMLHEDDYLQFKEILDSLPIKINYLIKITYKKLS